MENEICRICHTQIASHRFVRVINGIETSYALCSSCFAVMQNSKNDSQRLSALRLIPIEKRICPFCGLRYEDFRATGLLGCAECYRVFEEFLVTYIREYHGTDKHIERDLAIDIAKQSRKTETRDEEKVENLDARTQSRIELYRERSGK